MDFEISHHANDNTSDEYYFEIGKSAALNTNAATSALNPGLDGAYAEFKKREKNFTKERIIQYESNIQDISIERGKAEGELEKALVQKQLKDGDIGDKKSELQKIQSSEIQVNIFPFLMATVIVIALTLYIFMFYASTGYSAFFGIPSKLIGGFLAPTVFEDASIEGLGALVFIVLFPFVFLALGYMVHTFLEKRNYIGLGLSLLFTLAFDVFMAYKIAKNAHDILFASGQASEDWQANMAYEDVNFYIIIAAGFVVYVLWGYMLNYAIHQWHSIQPDQAKKAEIEKIREQLANMINAASELRSSIALLKSNLDNLKQKRLEIEKKLNILKSGGVTIDLIALKGMVGKFVGGWCFTIKFLFHAQKDLAERYTKEATEASNQWLDQTSVKLSDN